MIRMIQSVSAARAKTYFSDALTKTDYYIDTQELPGRFAGRLSQRLELTGTASKERFFALCESINPNTGNPLTQRTRNDRTVGYDINFHCPKSVSLIHAFSKDDHILKAFEGSVSETMRDIETDSLVRVRKNRRDENRKAGELLWAEFTHQTARPVDGFLPDPHLHRHCFVFNATWDDHEKKIKAGQFREIKRDMPYYQAMFLKRLSDKLMVLGYQIRTTEKSFELAGIPQAAIDLFSKRTDEIGRIAKEKGITDAKRLDELGASSRAKKQKGLTMPELKKNWRKQIAENVAYQPEEEQQPIRYAPKADRQRFSPQQFVDFSLHHSFERASVVQDRRLLAAAFQQSIGHDTVTPEAIKDCFNGDERIIRGRDSDRIYCTTVDVLQEEQTMVKLALQGRGKFEPLYAALPQIILDGQQGKAIAHVLTTCNQVAIIRGAAGVGKTTLMVEAAEHIAASGKELFVVAPTAQASRGVLRDEGFKNAETIAMLLMDKNFQNRLQGQVLWVDEAGLLGTGDTVAILKIATKQNARVVFGGDAKQHASVIRGDALRLLTEAGVEMVEVTKIRRQKNAVYKAAVKDLSGGNVKDAFVRLSEMGAIKEIDPDNPDVDLVTDYLQAIKKGKSALIVSPTHEQCDTVTIAVREKLKQAGLIGKRELPVRKLTNLNFTDAMKKDCRNYQKGQFVQFNQNAPGINRGSVWRVDRVKGNDISIVSQLEERQTLPFCKTNAFDVFRHSEIGLSKGDQVRITRNGFDEQNRRLNNGTFLEVTAIDKSGITLASKAGQSTYRLSKEFAHIDHAYCSTSHSAQGKTVDEVFISQPVSTFVATDAKQFYVSVSRGRDNVSIYTDDREALLEYASNAGDRRSALELVSGENTITQLLHKQSNKVTSAYRV